MKHQTIIAAGSLQRMIETAEAAWRKKDFSEAIETLERASRLAPSDLAILVRLGLKHGLRYDYAAAEQCFERALRIAPPNSRTDLLTSIAEQSNFFRNHEIRERYLLRAVAQPDKTPLACLKLAELYERHRRLPEATQFVEQALQLNPNYPAARLLQARLERLAGRLESAEQVLRSFITKPIPYPWTQALSWYELATVLDQQGRYDEAMTACNEAKTVLSTQAGKYYGKVISLIDTYKELKAQISTEILRGWQDTGPALIPKQRLALLCGYPRSGTTLLEQLLDAHPDVVSAEETDVFNDDAMPPLNRHSPPGALILNVLEKATVPVLQKARTGYFRAMEANLGGAIAGRMLVDKNPALTPQVPAFIRIFPETKFLFALRDPRDVVLSRFMLAQPVVPTTVSFLSLEGTAVDYAATMSFWRTLAPLLSGRFLEVRYEDMVEDLEPVARKTLDFLGVPWDDRVLKFTEHARQKIVRSPTYADVTQPVYKRAVGRWRNYQKYLEPHLEKLEPFVKVFGYE